MTTVTNSVAAKLFGAFAVVAVVMSFFAPAAQAQTEAQLQQMINDLLQQVQSLQSQLDGGGDFGMLSGVCPYTWTRDLSTGSTGSDVMKLQQFLNSDSDTRVAASGVGSTGMETQYYGALTAAAVSKFQVKYRSEVLSPSGLVNPTGYFGPSSRGKANAICVSSSMDDMDDGDDSSDDSSSDELGGGAGDIDVNQTSSGVDDEVLEGESDVPVLGFDIEADDSDVEIISINVEFEYEGATTGSDNLDRYIDEVTIWMGNEKIGSVDVDDFDENNDVYSENISVDGAVIREDDEHRFYVAVSAVNNIDSNDVSENWEIGLEDIRFRDGSGAVLTDSTGNGIVAGSGDGSIAETFAFEDLASAGNVELNVREDDEDINKARTVPVDDTSDTNDVEILSFTLDAEGSDIELQQLIFDITSSGAGVTEIANDFRLLMDGEEVGDLSYDLDQDGTGGESSASTTDAAIALLFQDLDDDDVVIEKDETVSFTLVADINDIDGGFSNGDSLSASLTGNATDIDADDQNGDSLANADISGTADSNNIKFAASGLMVEMTDTSASKVFNLDSSSSDDQGEFIMEFEVTAFEDTAWIELDAASSTDAAGDDHGLAFSIEDSSNNGVSAGTSTAIFQRISGGTISGNYVKINPGQTATLRATIYYDAAATGIYRVQANEIGFNQSSAAAANDAHDTVPAEDFQSDPVQVQN